MPLIPARFRRADPEAAKREALRKDVTAVALTMKAMQGIGAGTTASSVGAMGPTMPGSQFQGGWNNLGNASMAMLQRVTANMARQHNVPVAQIEAQLIEQGLSWGPPFPPGRPLDPFFGYRRPTRTWDFTVGENVQLTPRWSRISFETLRSIYYAYDVAQICVDMKIRDIRSLDYDWVPLEGERNDVSGDIDTAREFFAYPDRTQPFRNWLAEWLQDVLRYDAGAFYIRRTEAGVPYSLEVVSGATLIPIIDFYGRIAADRNDNQPPEGVWPGGDTPGYLQIIEGMPWDWLTADDIIYQAWNPLPESQYGQAPLEAILLSANTDIRFQQHFLEYFTVGTLPAGFMTAPQDLSDPAQIAELQETWDALMVGDQEMLRRIRFVPNGSEFTPVKNSDFDEKFPLYLMRRVAAAYGITPANLGFTETVNRATSDTQVDIQWRTGTLPLLRHVEDVINLIVSQHLKLRCRIQFDKGQEIEDRLMSMQAHQGYVDMGAISVDEVRAELGKPIDRSRPIPRMINNPRLGPIPLIAIESMSGQIDEDTYAPDKAQKLIPNPYIGVPGVAPAQGSPEQKAAAAASSQMQRDLLQATTGKGPTAEMKAAIAAAGSPGGPSQGPAGTTAQPAETPPGQGAGAYPTPVSAESDAKKEGLGGGGNVSGVFSSDSGIQGNPLSSGPGDPDDDDDDDAEYAFDEEWRAAKSLDALLELRRWRENTRSRMRKGQQPRQFRSSAIPPDVQALIWARLQKAESRQVVNAIFADVVSGRPFPEGWATGRGLRSGRLAKHSEDEARVSDGKPTGDAAWKAVREKAGRDDFAGVVAGGLVVQAQDTGCVLMIQRLPDKHDDDAAYARWEWPGGCLDVDDEGVWQGALREWEEETGATLDLDAEHVGSFLSQDGNYQTYVIQVPRESALDFDPQPEEISQVGWWDPADLDDGQVRDKVRDNLAGLQRFLLPSAVTKFDESEARAADGEWTSGGGGQVGHYGGSGREWPSAAVTAAQNAVPSDGPTVLPWKDPPVPAGKEAEAAGGGMTAIGITNTKLGDAVESVVVGSGKGFTEAHPGGRQGPFDVLCGKDAYEIKAVTTDSTEFKAKPSAQAMADKREFAQEFGLNPHIMIVVYDKDTQDIAMYSKPGVGAYRLSGPDKGWSYLGSAHLGRDTLGLAKAAAAALAVQRYHRNTDTVIAHYQALLARDYADLFSDEDLRAAIEETLTAAPLLGITKAEMAESVAKAVPPAVLVATAIAALRKRLGSLAPLKRTLLGLWGDAALQGAHGAAEMSGGTMGPLASVADKLPDYYWDRWRPGWGAAADKVAGDGLRDLLASANIEIKGVVDTRLRDLGNAMAAGIDKGDSIDTISKHLKGILTAPERSLLIANTEMARAMNAATMDAYHANGVARISWLAEATACELCVVNEDASPIGVNDQWPNGDVPVHPNCRCAVAPVVNMAHFPTGSGQPSPGSGSSDNGGSSAVAALFGDTTGDGWGGALKDDSDEARDARGRFTSGGGGSSQGDAAHFSVPSAMAASSNSYGGQVAQTATTPEQLYAEGEQTKPAFDDIVKGAAGKVPGAQAVAAPLKGLARATEKVDGRYDGDWSQLKDVVRGTMTVPKEADLGTALQSIQDQATAKGWKVASVENRFAAEDETGINVGPTDAGYRDVALNLVSPKGFVTELQVSTAPMQAAKSGEGHKLYKQTRVLEERGNLSPAEQATVAGKNAQMSALYAKAWNAGR